MKNIIISYINKITINNINEFAIKNNIYLSENELKYIHKTIKENYDQILKGNDEEIIDNINQNIKHPNNIKIINLYKTYKSKYQNYL